MARPKPRTTRRGLLELAAILGTTGVGAALGWVAASGVRSPVGGYTFGWVWPFAILAAMAAGVVGGAFIGMVLVRLMRRDNPCPRCGTGNGRGAALCVACDLPFR